MSLLLVPTTARAAAGDLETAFSGDGIVLSTPEFSAVAIAPDGKVVASPSGLQRGRTDLPIHEVGSAGYHIQWRRAGADPNPGQGYFWPFDVAVQPDGKILVSGHYRSSTPSVWRFTSSGVLDKTFSGNGKFFVQTPPGTPPCHGVGTAEEVALDSAGRIYLLNGQEPFSDCGQDVSGGTDNFFVPSVIRVSPTAYRTRPTVPGALRTRIAGRTPSGGLSISRSFRTDERSIAGYGGGSAYDDRCGWPPRGFVRHERGDHCLQLGGDRRRRGRYGRHHLRTRGNVGGRNPLPKHLPRHPGSPRYHRLARVEPVGRLPSERHGAAGNEGADDGRARLDRPTLHGHRPDRYHVRR